MKKELKSMGRRELQALCKKYGLRANTTNASMAASLASILEEADRAVMIEGEEMLQPGVRGQVVNMAVDDERFFTYNFKAISELPEHCDDISVSGTKGGSKVALANQSCENNTDPYAFLVDWNSMLIEEKAQSAKCPVTDDQFPASIIGTGETMESTMARDIIFDKEFLEENNTESATNEDKKKDKTIAGLTIVVASDFSTGGDVRTSNVLMEIFDKVDENVYEAIAAEEIKVAEDDDGVPEVMGEVSESTISSTKKGGQEATSTGSVTSTASVTSNASLVDENVYEAIAAQEIKVAENDDGVPEVMGEVINNSQEFTISSTKKGGQEALSNKNDSVATSTGSVTSTASVTSNASLVRPPLKLVQCTDVVIVLLIFLFFAYVTLAY